MWSRMISMLATLNSIVAIVVTDYDNFFRRISLSMTS